MNLDAYVTEIVFDRAGRASFALGDGTVAGEGGERQPASDHLAERPKIWLHAEERCRSGAGDAETCDHLVEDQERPRGVAG